LGKALFIVVCKRSFSSTEARASTQILKDIYLLKDTGKRVLSFFAGTSLHASGPRAIFSARTTLSEIAGNT
jgi:hypothetical protein